MANVMLAAQPGPIALGRFIDWSLTCEPQHNSLIAVGLLSEAESISLTALIRIFRHISVRLDGPLCAGSWIAPEFLNSRLA